MKRSWITAPFALLALATLVLAGCGGSTSSTESSASGVSSTAEGTAGPVSSGVAATDFSTVLADGSTFVLSEQTKPTYLVFWAEW